MSTTPPMNRAGSLKTLADSPQGRDVAPLEVDGELFYDGQLDFEGIEEGDPCVGDEDVYMKQDHRGGNLDNRKLKIKQLRERILADRSFKGIAFTHPSAPRCVMCPMNTETRIELCRFRRDIGGSLTPPAAGAPSALERRSRSSTTLQPRCCPAPQSARAQPCTRTDPMPPWSASSGPAATTSKSQPCSSSSTGAAPPVPSVRLRSTPISALTTQLRPHPAGGGGRHSTGASTIA